MMVLNVCCSLYEFGVSDKHSGQLFEEPLLLCTQSRRPLNPQWDPFRIHLARVDLCFPGLPSREAALTAVPHSRIQEHTKTRFVSLSESSEHCDLQRDIRIPKIDLHKSSTWS
jgi:hypothetical protein